MFIEEFSFGNFRSFKDVQTLRLSAAKITSKNKSLDTNNVLTINNKTRLLKSKVIYGANASGKSNVIRALNYFKLFIQDNIKGDDFFEFMEPFAYSTETEHEPCFFQLIFHIENVRYRYGFEATKNEIHSEWLYLTNNVREIPVFIRDKQQIIEVSKKYLDKGYEIAQMKAKLFTEKRLFLSLIETFGDMLAEILVTNINNILIITADYYKYADENLSLFMKVQGKTNAIVDLLKLADIGIKELNLHTIKEENNNDSDILTTSHSIYNEKLEEIGMHENRFEHIESDGTKQLLYFSPFIIASITGGFPLIIDEFGSELHPMLTKKIFQLYNNEKVTSQLIVSTHTTELMSSDLLRRDQIDFVEKDKYGRSYLYTLAELKGVRSNTNFESDYFQGKYGAIPFLGNLEEFAKIYDESIEIKEVEK
jgi:AAA15 family ATPase/GTPase